MAPSSDQRKSRVDARPASDGEGKSIEGNSSCPARLMLLASLGGAVATNRPSLAVELLPTFCAHRTTGNA